MSKFIDSAQFRAAPKAGQNVHKGYSFQTKGMDVAARTVSFVASTEAIDRMGDSITLAGWRLDRFKQNPVILFGHDSRDLPIGKAISVGIEGNALVVTVQFASAEANPMAENVFRLIQEGCLNAVSVGFIPIRWEFVEDVENGRCGFDILEAELLEISVVPIPAHPDALVQAGMKGLDASPMLAWMREQAGGAGPKSPDLDAKAANVDADTAKGDTPEELPDDDAKGGEAPVDDTPEDEDGCDKPVKAFSVKRAGLICRFLKLKRAA
ncbi:HK97 family phage prohead protease [Solidesulfovibrio sp.]